MTVLLVGVGTDSDHVQPELHLDEDGRFEYLPIPETETEATAITYGEWELEHHDGTAMDLISKIAPHGDDNWITDTNTIANHPVHHDPNFEALTFGDRRGGGGKGAQIVSNLESGDVLGFYTGIKQGPDDSMFHRYLYGYMTVNEIHDLSELPKEEYCETLQEFSENAHAKRLIGSGTPKHDDVVIVDGREPAMKLTYPTRMSERLEQSPWYKITDGFADEFAVETGLKGICRKFPVRMNLSRDEFVRKVESRNTL